MKITIRQPLSFSEIGRKDNQEDCIYPSASEANDRNRVFVLCDGVGGHENGEVASQTVCEVLGSSLNHVLEAAPVVTADMFREALAHAYDELDKKDSGGMKKMGTTMTCLCLHSEGCLVAHIGDSRIYHLRPTCTDVEKGRLGIVYQSSDHSLVNDLLRAGELTEEEAQNYPHKNIITRAMQPHQERRCKADIFSFRDVREGDYFFLCSDGVMEQLTNEKLCSIVADKALNDEEKLEAIRGVCAGETRDNYTAYLIPIEGVVAEEGDQESEEDVIRGLVEDVAEETQSEETPTNHESQRPNIFSSVMHRLSLWKVLFWVGVALLLAGSIAYMVKWRKKDAETIEVNSEDEVKKEVPEVAMPLV